HSLDFLLIALVLLILGLGVAKLFLLPPSAVARRIYALPTWLNMETFSELKVLLWETILVALVVFALPTLSSDLAGRLEWSALILPAAITLMALGLFLMKRA
ncbi:MAG TPA: YqhA family protein, partial [Polyangia bacterium]|nr:YqhA family protein [Polyangia bacterium]